MPCGESGKCAIWYISPMPITEWSENITLAQMTDEPMFSEDMEMLLRRSDDAADHVPDVVIDLKHVSYLNSSNLAQLLKLRKKLQMRNRRMRICCLNDAIWSVMLTTGLDSVFSFNEDISTSLASLQVS
jgi:anti-anti-sigma factor